MDVLAGGATSVRIDFVTPIGAQSADAGSCQYTLYGQDGVPLVSASPLAPNPVDDTGITVAIAANLLTISPDRSFEKRRLRVVWTSAGQAYAAERTLRVIPYLNHSVVPADVRAALGLNEDDLADEEVDLLVAYFSVEDELGALILQEALQSGDLDELQANDAILHTAILRLIPSLRLRAAQSQSNGPLKFERFRDTPDFDGLERVSIGVLAVALAWLDGRIISSPALMVLSGPADPFTG